VRVFGLVAAWSTNLFAARIRLMITWSPLPSGRAVAIELPGPVVSFLNIIGVSWPNVNEDKVREFATHIREFASAVDTTHQHATDTVKQLGAHYKGASYEALLTAWGEKSSTHMTELVRRAG